MKIKNRITNARNDYLFKIVRRPEGWQPETVEDIPPAGEVLSVDYVASFEEARDDLLRCNSLSLEKNLDKWAVVQSAGGEL